MRITLTLDEATDLFNITGSFGLVTKQDTEKGGEWWADRASQEQDVLKLWKKITAFARRKSGRNWEFGPEKPEPDWTCELNLHDEERDGMYWVLLSALDPRSPLKQRMGVCAETIWPMVRKIKREFAMRKELKLNDTKPRKIEDDPEPKTEENGKPVEQAEKAET
jgi:hypothetical protein